MATTNFCSINCAKGVTGQGPLLNAACFMEGYITSTIEADHFDEWASCRVKKTDACGQVESALNDFFGGSMMAGVKELEGTIDAIKDMAGTCTSAWKKELGGLAFWGFTQIAFPEALGRNITIAFVDDNGPLAEVIGEMVNDLFYDHYYFGAGNNLGLMIN